MEIDKNTLIDSEIEKLNEIFADIPDQQKKLVEGLIQNAAFMRITLIELQQMVNEKGAMISCVSGNGFETIKDNPAQKAYTTMISRYSGIIDQLKKLLPESDTTDQLMEFIG